MRRGRPVSAGFPALRQRVQGLQSSRSRTARHCAGRGVAAGAMCALGARSARPLPVRRSFASVPTGSRSTGSRRAPPSNAVCAVATGRHWNAQAAARGCNCATGANGAADGMPHRIGGYRVTCPFRWVRDFHPSPRPERDEGDVMRQPERPRWRMVRAGSAALRDCDTAPRAGPASRPSLRGSRVLRDAGSTPHPGASRSRGSACLCRDLPVR